MAKMKTAISIKESLFREVDVLAHKMHISRSDLFTKAVEDFIKRQQNVEILHRLNKVYDEPDEKERKWHSQTKARHRRLVEGEW